MSARNKKKEPAAGSLAATGGMRPALTLTVLVGAPRGRLAATSVAFSAKELKQAGLEPGDPLLLTSPLGHRTVAICEAGGPGGGVLLAAAVRRSLAAQDGEELSASADFTAVEAAAVQLEAPPALEQAWQELAGGLRLDRYMQAALDGTLLLPGDVRTLSVSGRPYDVRVVSCAATGAPGAGPKLASNAEVGDAGAAAGNGDKAAVAALPPCLVTTATAVRVRCEAPADRSAGQGASGGGTADAAAGAGAAPAGFQRVGGLRQIIDELREAVQLPLERPDLYRQLGVGPPRGVLLYGPPGTGKTLLARSLAEELGCPVELCAATDLVGRGPGESEARIAGLFARARQAARSRGTGALLFIDEIDAICPKRDDATEAERRMVAAFLTALDGVSSDDSVVVLGATNRPDAIDPAMRRAGRLERELEVGVPNAEERDQILVVHLAGLRHDLSEDQRRELARRCHGYVGADLRGVCTSAARAALRAGRGAVALEDCLAAMRTVPPSALKELLVEVPHVRWSDIGGYESTKEALREAVEWPIRHAWAFQAMDVDPPRGVLLYGPPGCSKTMMAKAVATETEMNFVSIKGPELFSKYVGDSEKAVRDVFRKARTAAPCVIFFDEIDAIGASREGEGAGGVAARVLAQLLAEMDGVSAAGARRHVVVLAATNRPHVLDAALMRPGRFDRLVHVPLPDAAAREAVFRGQLARMKVADAPEFSELVRRTEGCSGAEVVMACREAALLAIREAVAAAAGDDGVAAAAPAVSREHLERAIAAVRPRISPETVQFYVDFERKMQHA